MRCITALNELLTHSGIFLLMLRISSGNMSTDCAQIDAFPAFCKKKHQFRQILVEAFKYSEVLFILGRFCCNLFVTFFIQWLTKNTGRPLGWIPVFGPGLLFFLLRATSKFAYH